MIRTILIILILGVLISCSSNNGQVNSNTTTNPLEGCWISEDYFNSIKEFKSPLKAQNGSLFFVISDTTHNEVMMSYNFHEGAPETLNNLQIISPTKIKLADKNFVRINPLHREYDYYRILEEILFKGRYTTTEGKRIEFKNNGQVEGLEEFHFYEPLIDYFDEGCQVDQIRFMKESREFGEYYGFKFKADTLELYKLHCLEFDSVSKMCGVVEFGQLIYRLHKTE